MSKETITRYLDDLDPTQEASETVPIGYRGFLYEVDLTDEHVKELDSLLAPYIESARKVKWGKRIQAAERAAAPAVKTPRKQTTLTPEQRRAARAWGRENGFEVKTRGYLSPTLVKAYKKANRGIPKT